MIRPYECPDCNCRHDEPAEATYLLTARCLDCELEELYRIGDTLVGERDLGYDLVSRAA